MENNHKSVLEKMRDAVRKATLAVRNMVPRDTYNNSINKSKSADEMKAIIDKAAASKKKKVDKEMARLKAKIEKQNSLAKEKVDQAAANITRARTKSEQRIQDIKNAEEVFVDKELKKIQRAKDKAGSKITGVLGETDAKVCAAKDQEQEARRKSVRNLKETLKKINLKDEDLPNTQDLKENTGNMGLVVAKAEVKTRDVSVPNGSAGDDVKKSE